MTEKMYRIEMNKDFLAENIGDALRKIGEWLITASLNPEVMTNRAGIFKLLGVIRLGLKEEFHGE